MGRKKLAGMRKKAKAENVKNARKVPFDIKFGPRPKYGDPEFEDTELHEQIYNNCDTKRYQGEIGKFVWDPERYKKYERKYSYPEFQPKMLNGLRCLVGIHTAQALCGGRYFLPPKPRASKVEAIQFVQEENPTIYVPTTIRTPQKREQEDSVSLENQGKPPVVLDAKLDSSPIKSTDIIGNRPGIFTNTQSKQSTQKNRKKRREKDVLYTDEDDQLPIVPFPGQKADTQPREPVVIRLDKKAMIKSTKESVLYRDDNFELELAVKKYRTEIFVAAMDCLEAGVEAAKKWKTKPVVLVNGSQNNPGGGFTSGMAAQEEDICRRTGLIHCLDDPWFLEPKRNWSYPIPEFGAMYSKDVFVFRHGAEKGYAFMQRPMKLGFINQAAYKSPPIKETGGQQELSNRVKKCILRKLAAVLNTAVIHNHEVLILGAFGCGVYENPPNVIARLFHQLLGPGGRFEGVFRAVIFAIVDGRPARHNPKGNLHPFANIFGVEPVETLL